MKKLTEKEIETSLKKLKGWEYIDGSITKKYFFKTHNECFGFITRIALLAEKMNHHPNWSGVYNQVTIKLSTHDIKGISELDLEFAKEIELY